RSARISTETRILHVLCGVGDGEPRAARRRPLLRIRRQALGEPVRAFHGGVEIRRCEARGGDRSAHRAKGDREGDAAITEEIHARAAPPVLGGRWIQRQGQRHGDEDGSSREFLRRNYTDVEGGRYARARDAKDPPEGGAP